MEFGFEPVYDQLRTSFEPASVMEFGFKRLMRKLAVDNYYSHIIVDRPLNR